MSVGEIVMLENWNYQLIKPCDLQEWDTSSTKSKS